MGGRVLTIHLPLKGAESRGARPALATRVERFRCSRARQVLGMEFSEALFRANGLNGPSARGSPRAMRGLRRAHFLFRARGPGKCSRYLPHSKRTVTRPATADGKAGITSGPLATVANLPRRGRALPRQPRIQPLPSCPRRFQNSGLLRKRPSIAHGDWPLDAGKRVSPTSHRGLDVGLWGHQVFAIQPLGDAFHRGALVQRPLVAPVNSARPAPSDYLDPPGPSTVAAALAKSPWSGRA